MFNYQFVISRFTDCEFIKYRHQLKVLEIIQRIKDAYNLGTDAEVAKFLDIKPSTLSMQKNRGRLNLKRILNKCSDLNRNWLLDGEGPKKKESLNSASTRIPVYSSLAVEDTGKPNLQNSTAEGYIFVDVSGNMGDFLSSNMIGYIVSGDEMCPTLRPDDIAIVNLDSALPRDETVFLFSLGQKELCRRIKKNSSGHYSIHTDNGTKDSSEISKGQDNYEIIGEMIWIVRTATCVESDC